MARPTEDEDYEKLLEGIIRRRRWRDVRNLWLDSIPNIEPPGAPPPSTPSSVAGFDQLVEPLVSDEEAETFGTISELRSCLLHEGIFLLHKASHVISAAEQQIQGGICTWSISNAYQGSVFGARAALCFLGIYVTQYKGKTLLLDLLDEDLYLRKGAFRSIKDEELSWPVSHVHKILDGPLSHRKLWQIFQRLLRVTNADCWPARTVRLIAQLEISAFAHQRNLLHYRSESWFMDDLLAPKCDSTFAPFHWETCFDRSELDRERIDFSIALAFSVLKLAYLLLEDLARLTKRIEPDWVLVKAGLSLSRHPVFGSSSMDQAKQVESVQ